MGSQPHPTVLVVGDSISNHWMEALPVALGSAASCSGGSDWSASDWSAGRGTGCDSTQALAYLSSTLHPDGTLPDVLLLNCGLHDIKCSVADGRHQVEPEQYSAVPAKLGGHPRAFSDPQHQTLLGEHHTGVHGT
jgi:hypothetical protein